MNFAPWTGQWLVMVSAFMLIAAQEPPPKTPPNPDPSKAKGPANRPGDPPIISTRKMPLSGLAPGKIIPDLSSVRYRVSTDSKECQTFCDQGLGYLYSYVWMEASRSFETATQKDPECALAWWGLSRALDRWAWGDPAKQGLHEAANKALQKSYDLRDRASHREQLLIQARMQEKGLAPFANGSAEARKKTATDTIDTMISLFDDDEEAWFYRAQLGGGENLFGGNSSSAPFYKALVRINALHPAANHELLHHYENIQRPALGWVYAENYIKSSPGIPHPFHMQAHLATRLGRWDKTCDRSTHAIELERAYHKDMSVKPPEDRQFSHHLEVLTLSLVHDGRFREAHELRKEVEGYGFHYWMPWFRMALCERDWMDAEKIVQEYRKTDKKMAAYLSARLYLAKGEPARAAPEVEVLQQGFQEEKTNRQLEYRLWETQGQLMCMTGAIDQGLALLAKAVDRSKSDYSHHSWGNGSYFMEVWGTMALQVGKMEVAEEAFLEALAHDPGSVRGALGMQVLCEQQSRPEEARRYAEMAHRAWRRAEVRSLDAELVALRKGITTKSQRALRQEENPKAAVENREVHP
jgi:Tfp pilus assembly protein PilF